MFTALSFCPLAPKNELSLDSWEGTGRESPQRREWGRWYSRVCVTTGVVKGLGTNTEGLCWGAWRNKIC